MKKISGMVDVSAKKLTKRIARATCHVYLAKSVFDKVLKQGSPKGDIFEAARVAGIMAAKKTPDLIPLCHQIKIKKARIDFKVDPNKYSIEINSEIVGFDQTGFEMEALVASSIAALTIYDMLKCFDKKIFITDLHLVYKSGGKSGIFKA
ncbi:MAG: cyclic pyranopterin monophosphate synthase MoaC [Candidatus Omnitrophota bacterium]